VSINRFCTFLADGMTFGVPVDRVQEAIIDEHAITPVPLAHPSVAGLMNLRGRIITIIDLRHRLELTPRTASDSKQHIIIHVEDSLISLLVDETGDVMDVDDAIFEPPPENITETTSRLIRGAYKLDDRLLFALNLDETINVSQATVNALTI
jgi:purine-binding chemotaxis protein CheW